jgi:hypothetical protein
MKRRTLKRHRPGSKPELHHHVDVVLLKPAVRKIRKVKIDKIRCQGVYLRTLREKLEHDPSHPALLITEPGVGIRLAL